MKESLHRPAGAAYAVPGIAGGVCQRCGALVPDAFRDEYGRRYCRACLAFGHVDETTVLYRQERPLPPVDHRFVPAFALTPEQVTLSERACAVVLDGGSVEIHAVCGAGKTEVLYAAIHAVLERGGRVCLAIPRRDVVKELAQRLAAVFPTSGVRPLHQGAKDDEGAHLLVATVHQLVGYHQEFDLLVLDEADAFPYRDDPLLHRLVRKAMKPDAAYVEMTATPPTDVMGDPWFLPARFHRHALDVPVVAYVGGLRADILAGRIPPDLETWLRKDGVVRRALLFVPAIVYGVSLAMGLKAGGFRARFVSSREPAVPVILRSFREERFELLVTTTLLERGVTFSAIDVGVLSADDDVFARNVLVQIAGRVGRDPRHPTGEIRLFAEVSTAAMARAIQSIRQANDLARGKGLLDDL